MLQRIQSIYLFIAALALALMALHPLVNIHQQTGDETQTVRLTLYAIDYEKSGSELVTASQDNMALAYLAYGVAFVLFISIFLFKNRPLQMRLSRMGALLSGALLFSFSVTAYRAAASIPLENPTWSLGWTFFLPLVALIACILAYFRIKADEALVRSVDRIR